MSELPQIWSALQATPAFGVALTLAGYEIGCWMQWRLGANPIVNPVAIAVTLIISILLLTGTRYQTYFDGARWIHFLLGPATVALAIPLYRNLAELRRSAVAILVAVTAGAVAASASAVAIAWSLGGSVELLRSIAAKSITAPIAIAVSGQIGGVPELTAVLVVVTGVLGGAFAPELLALLGVRCWRAGGVAAGVVGHGIATARMLSINETAGAFSALAMGLCGLVTAILLPVVARLL